MEISITAVTRNRRLSKALIRHSGELTRLKQVGQWIETSTLPYDVLQIVLLDRNEDYARAVGCKNDRIFQVEVAAPNEATVPFNDERKFVRYVAERLQTAIKLGCLPVSIEKEIADEVSSFT